MRAAALLAASGVLGACGSAGGPGRACTDIGAPTGVALDISPPYAAKVSRATMTVCHDGACHDSRIRLDPSTKARPEGCSNGVCHASSVPTGGKHGFGLVDGLPKRPVRVTVVLRGTSGDRLLHQAVTVNPTGVFPNGRGCGEVATQARVEVTDGHLRAV